MSEMTSKQFVDLLKQVVKLYEKNPELPTPVGWSNDLYLSARDLTKEQMALVARSFPRVAKEYGEYSLTITKELFPAGTTPEEKENWRTPKVSLSFACPRDQVCVRKVIGTKIIPAEVIPERTIEAREVEVVEWECLPVTKR